MRTTNQSTIIQYLVINWLFNWTYIPQLVYRNLQTTGFGVFTTSSVILVLDIQLRIKNNKELKDKYTLSLLQTMFSFSIYGLTFMAFNCFNYCNNYITKYHPILEYKC